MRHWRVSILCILAATAVMVGGGSASEKKIVAGDEASAVLALRGEPNFWGNLDDENPSNGSYSLDTSWQTTGGVAPEKVPGTMAWVYFEKPHSILGEATIVMFVDGRVTRVTKGSVDELYDP